MLQTRRFTFRHECGRSYTHQGFAYSGARADSIGPANSATSERAIHRCSRKKAVTRPERWFYSIWTITIQQRQPDRERPKRLGARTRRPEIHPEPAQKHHHREPGDDEDCECVAGVEGAEIKLVIRALSHDGAMEPATSSKPSRQWPCRSVPG